MASDAYLKIEGINGESEDERHRNWIEVNNVLYAIHQPRADVVSTAGGIPPGEPIYTPSISASSLTWLPLSCCKRVQPGRRYKKLASSSCEPMATASLFRISRSNLRI